MKKLILLTTGITLLLLLSACNLPEEYNTINKENVSKKPNEEKAIYAEVDPDKIKPPTGG
ncbi:hypothetical protein [Flavobacterium psychrophilum]|uniref:hypothetical protein n=1 Tax=Flavobacterium psychrophilum TaxID=96345 RepID=UPI00106DAC18|nr:hypothetical protein [Flavobacterium psychrophilum]